MDISIATIKILYLGIPGVIAYLVSDKMVIRKYHDISHVAVSVFIYSIISYAILSVVLFMFGEEINYVYLQVVSNDMSGNEVPILLGGSSVGIIYSFIISLEFRYCLLNKIGKFFRVTARYGDVDVWHFFNNSPMDEKNDGYLYVRDLKTGFTYYGYIQLYSDSEQDRELVISDVSVYKSESGEHCYDLKNLYLSRNRDDITIEVPNQAEGESDVEPTKQSEEAAN